MPATIIGTKALFGRMEPKLLEGFPEGRARIRMRQDEFVLVRIKTADGIREFYPMEKDGKWIPAHEGGRNVTV
jgi:hypothetical protein